MCHRLARGHAQLVASKEVPYRKLCGKARFRLASHGLQVLERLDELRVDLAGLVEEVARPPKEVAPLDDPYLWQRLELGDISAPELPHQRRELEELGEDPRPKIRPFGSVEVEVEVVFGPHHAVSEAVGGHGELKRHEELVLAWVVDPVAVLDDVVHDRGLGDLLEEVVDDYVLVVAA